MRAADDMRCNALARPGRTVALRLLLALLWLGTTAVAATHHHGADTSAVCQACHAAHGAALTAPASLPALAPSGRAAPPLPCLHLTVLSVDLRVRGPPSLDGRA